MKKSIIQVFKSFSDYANAHQQIDSFRTAPITENTSKDLVYPLMWIDIQGLNIAFQTGLMLMSVPVYFLDRVERDYSNVVSVLSVCALNADDFYTYYTDNECEFGFYFDDGASMSPVIYEFDDIVAGYTMNINCKIGNARNESQIPMS